MADDDIYATSPIPVYTVVLSISSPNSRVTVGGISQTIVNVSDDDGMSVMCVYDLLSFRGHAVDILVFLIDPVLALSQSSYTFAEVTEETGEICVVLEGPPGGLETGTLEVMLTIDTGNTNRPAS